LVEREEGAEARQREGAELRKHRPRGCRPSDRKRVEGDDEAGHGAREEPPVGAAMGVGVRELVVERAVRLQVGAVRGAADARSALAVELERGGLAHEPLDGSQGADAAAEGTLAVEERTAHEG